MAGKSGGWWEPDAVDFLNRTKARFMDELDTWAILYAAPRDLVVAERMFKETIRRVSLKGE